VAAYDNSGTLEEQLERIRARTGVASPPVSPLGDAAPDDELETVSLEALEGNTPFGVVPSENSGATFGRGFDVGQRDASELNAMLGPLAQRFLPYAGLKGQAARAALAAAPIFLDPTEVEAVNAAAAKQSLERARAGVREKWDKLSGRERSILRNIAHHYGHVPPGVRDAFMGDDVNARPQAIRRLGEVEPMFKQRYESEANSLVDHYASMADPALAAAPAAAPADVAPAATQGEAYSELGAGFAALTDPTELAYQFGFDAPGRDPAAPSIVQRLLGGQQKLEERPVARIQPGKLLEGSLPITTEPYSPGELEQKRSGELSYLSDFPITTLDVGLNLIFSGVGIPAKIAKLLAKGDMITVKGAQAAQKALGAEVGKLTQLTTRASQATQPALRDSLTRKIAAQTARVEQLETAATRKAIAAKEILAKVGVGAAGRAVAGEIATQTGTDVLAGMVGGGVAEAVGPEHPGLGAVAGLAAGVASPAIAAGTVGAVRRGVKGALTSPAEPKAPPKLEPGDYTRTSPTAAALGDSGRISGADYARPAPRPEAEPFTTLPRPAPSAETGDAVFSHPPLPTKQIPETMEAVEERLAIQAKNLRIPPDRRILLDQVVEHHVGEKNRSKATLEIKLADLVTAADLDDPIDNPHLAKTADVIRALQTPRDLNLKRHEVAYIQRALDIVQRDLRADPLPNAPGPVREEMRRRSAQAVTRDAAENLAKSADENALTDAQRRRIDDVDTASPIELQETLGRAPTRGEADYLNARRAQEQRAVEAARPGGEALASGAAEAAQLRQRRGVAAPESAAPKPIDPPSVPGGSGAAVAATPPGTAPRTYAAKGAARTTDQGTVARTEDGRVAPVAGPEVSRETLPETLWHISTAPDAKVLVAQASEDGSPAHVRLLKSEDEAKVARADLAALRDLARSPSIGDAQATLRRAVSHDLSSGAMPKSALPTSEGLGTLVEHLITSPKIVGSLSDPGEKAVAAYRRYMQEREGLGGARATQIDATVPDLALMQGSPRVLVVPKGAIPADHLITAGKGSPNEVRVYGDIPGVTKAAKGGRPLATAGEAVGPTGRPVRKSPKLTPRERAGLGGVPEHDMRKRGEQANLFRRPDDLFDDGSVLHFEGESFRPQKAAPSSVGRGTHGTAPPRRGEPLSTPEPPTPRGRPIDWSAAVLSKRALPRDAGIGRRVWRSVSSIHDGLAQIFHPGHAIFEGTPDVRSGVTGRELVKATQIMREEMAGGSVYNQAQRHYLDHAIQQLRKGYRAVRRGLKGAFEVADEWSDGTVVEFIANREHRLPQRDGGGATAAEKEAIAGAMDALLKVQQSVYEKLTDTQRKIWHDNYFPRIWDLKATMKNQARLIREGIVEERPDGSWAKAADGAPVLMLERADAKAAQESYRRLRDSKHFVGKRVQFVEADNPFDYFTDMVNSGFVPMTKNPVEMVLAKLEQMGAWATTTRILERLAEQGIVKKLTQREYDRLATMAQRAGKPFDLVPVDDIMTGIPLAPNAKDAVATSRSPLDGKEGLVFVAPHGVANVLRNYSSKGLIGQGKMGSWFEGWRNANGLLNGIQLSLSPFHAITIGIEIAITNLEAAANRVAAGTLTALGRRSYYNVAKKRPFTSRELFAAGGRHALQATTLTSVPSLYFGRGAKLQAQWQDMIARGLKETVEGRARPLRADNLPVLDHVDQDVLSMVGVLRTGANDMAHSLGKDFDPTIPLVLELALRSGMRPMEHRHGFHRTFYRSFENARQFVNSQPDGFSKLTATGGAAAMEGFHQVQRALQWMSKPIFESLVPRAKLQAYVDMMGWELAKLGPDVDPDKLMKTAMLVQDSVDNRFGEFVYDNMMLHRVFRDFLFLTQRAPGWNWGTIREIGGGALDMGRLAALKGTRAVGRVGEKLGVAGAEKLAQRQAVRGVDEWTRRASYNVALAAETVLFGGLYQMMTTGVWPGDELEEGWWQSPDGVQDAFWRFTFPKNGQMRGNHFERIAHPGYAKEVNAWTHDLPGSLVETASHKLAPGFALLNTFISGEDYFGNLLHDPEAPLPKQWLDRAVGAAKEAGPFSFSTAATRQERVGAEGFGAAAGKALSGDFAGAKAALDPQALGESLLSLNPAPARMIGSESENLMTEYQRLRRPPPSKSPREFKRLDARKKIVQSVRAGREPHIEDVRTFASLSGAEGLSKLNRLRRDLATTTPYQSRFKSYLIGGFKSDEFYQLREVIDAMDQQEFGQVQGLAFRAVVGAMKRAPTPQEAEQIRRWWQATVSQKSGARRAG
jgi:hypothetical protein